MDILDAYILKKPSQQNVLDIFQGEWSSQFPDEFQLTTEPGRARLFEDGRVVWTEQVFGSLADWKILELGPLEAGHSYMFQARGAEKVTAIEANTRSFLKCLCVKEILGLALSHGRAIAASKAHFRSVASTLRLDALL